jgi:Asp-tRNA(Asn)/Glu-tRNA(Gln) amidotransferase A subunit family amidase
MSGLTSHMLATAYEPIAEQLPIGFQLLGEALDEARILQIAHAYEQSTDWHKARSPKSANRDGTCRFLRLTTVRRNS